MKNEKLRCAAARHGLKKCLKRGLLFEPRLPVTTPTAIGGMNRAELDCEITNGVESLRAGKGLSADEVDAVLAREFGI